jgi:hypothetical protein
LLDQEETPFCQALVELGFANMGVPERLHPKSFHSVFSHNTNVWATRNKQVGCEPGCVTELLLCQGVF